MASKHGRQTRGGTPGRRANITGNQYFDIGKVGRKTGITLKDTGIRDDYGLEPMSGIFSSPGSAQRSSYMEDDGSADMEGLDSIMPDVDETLRSRKSSRFPLTRATPPRRSNITGSPRRQSSAQKQSRTAHDSPDEPRITNRRLDFRDNGVRLSIEKQSPFKPKHVLRRSTVGKVIGENQQPQQRVSESIHNIPSSASRHSMNSPASRSGHRRTTVYTDVHEPIPDQQYLDEEDAIGYQQDDTLQYSTRDEIEGTLQLANSLLHGSSPTTPRKRRRTEERQSDTRYSSKNVHQVPEIAQMTAASSQKQARRNIPFQHDDEDDEETTHHFASGIAPTSTRHPELPLSNDQVLDNGYDGPDEYSDDDDGGSIDLPIAEPSDNGEEERSQSPERIQETNARKRKASPKKARVRIAAPPPRQRSGSVTSDSDSDDAETSRTKRAGSRSNVQLRSTTPFEDARQQTTRSGRPIMKPLDWWAGESVIWKHGEVEGVIRAESIEPEKKAGNKKRKAHMTKTKKIKAGLDAIDEQDEDLLPSDWEEEIGVLTGDVAEWNSTLENGDDKHIITEDLAFAASSIVTRAVHGATFSYAKIQTLRFFGSGVVEIPPEGVKTTKNSRKMQMNFFVHKGKVEVEITTPTSTEQPNPVRTSIFSITEGGAWIVPRGNNYTIRNLSSATTAFIFFSQGCEVDASEE